MPITVPATVPEICGPAASLDTPPNPRRTHVQRLYTRRGYVEVVAGRAALANPDQIELLVWTQATYEQDKASGKPYTRKWVLVDPAQPETFAALDHYVTQLAQRYGNVYTSVAQHSDASRRSPQPSPIILIEDSPNPASLPLAPTWAAQTSPHSWHSYYLLERNLLPWERQRLSKQLARAVGGDPSGVDAEQLTRPPLTRNTKGKHGPDGYAVHFVAGSEQVYTVAEIETIFPSTQNRNDNNSGDVTRIGDWGSYRDQLDDAQVESYLHTVGQYLKDDGLPRRLSAKARAFWSTTLAWSDTSAARWALAHSLLLHRYPLELATALLYHTTYNRTKGAAWSLDDAAACVVQQATMLGEAYQPSAERTQGKGETRAPATDTLPDRPRKRGRPLGSTGARWAALRRLLTRRWEDDADLLTGQCCYYADDLAEQLGISTRALHGYLQTLEAQGRLERGQHGGPGGRP